MAIAGLHNVSVLDSSFPRDSQPQAQRRFGTEGRANTNASLLLRISQELEDERVLPHTENGIEESTVQNRSHSFSTEVLEADGSERVDREHRDEYENVSIGDTDCETWSELPAGSQNEDDDPSNLHYEHSRDFGEVERERVRQIFRKWMNGGGRERMPNVSHADSNSRGEWLGQTEQERVRIIRLNTQQRDASGDSREDQAAEIGTEIERVRDGFIINQSNGQTQNARRGIRRLCGRQALVDMLKKAERERQIEIQGLSAQRTVSHFAHRNRIQSLLKSRFLRNDRLVENERHVSLTEGELGLLRQRQTVSGLREGFLSRSQRSSINDQASSSACDTSNSVTNSVDALDEARSSDVVDVLREQSVPINVERGNDEIYSIVLSDVGCDLEENNVEERPEIAHEAESWQHRFCNIGARECQMSNGVQSVVGGDGNGENNDGIVGDSATIRATEEALLTEDGANPNVGELGILNDRSDASNEENGIDGLLPHTDDSESNMDDVNGQDFAVEVQEWQEQYMNGDSSDREPSDIDNNRWEETTAEVVDRNRLESDANDQSQEFWGYGGEDNPLPEGFESSPESGNLQDPVPNWFDGPSNQEALPASMLETYYFHHDDNAYSSEIRELLNRRRVSNLLSSGFRENLDRLIQSYVERQGHSNDWELDGSSPTPVSAEEESERQGRDQTVGQRVAAESPRLALPSPETTPQPLWDHELPNDNWSSRDMHQQLSLEWDFVHDLRMDMARLQQRMGNLQRMLETCMDMQLELQRAIRQEVAAALNLSATAEGVFEDSYPNDASKWDNVRKGICCVCCDSNIDSLLYRCGHMCTCSKCANNLVENRGKCPMCRAPVVEVIRAYSIC